MKFGGEVDIIGTLLYIELIIFYLLFLYSFAKFFNSKEHTVHPVKATDTDQPTRIVPITYIFTN